MDKLRENVYENENEKIKMRQDRKDILENIDKNSDYVNKMVEEKVFRSLDNDDSYSSFNYQKGSICLEDIKTKQLDLVELLEENSKFFDINCMPDTIAINDNTISVITTDQVKMQISLVTNDNELNYKISLGLVDYNLDVSDEQIPGLDVFEYNLKLLYSNAKKFIDNPYLLKLKGVFDDTNAMNSNYATYFLNRLKMVYEDPEEQALFRKFCETIKYKNICNVGGEIHVLLEMQDENLIRQLGKTKLNVFLKINSFLLKHKDLKTENNKNLRLPININFYIVEEDLSVKNYSSKSDVYYGVNYDQVNNSILGNIALGDYLIKNDTRFNGKNQINISEGCKVGLDTNEQAYILCGIKDLKGIDKRTENTFTVQAMLEKRDYFIPNGNREIKDFYKSIENDNILGVFAQIRRIFEGDKYILSSIDHPDYLCTNYTASGLVNYAALAKSLGMYPLQCSLDTRGHNLLCIDFYPNVNKATNKKQKNKKRKIENKIVNRLMPLIEEMVESNILELSDEEIVQIVKEKFFISLLDTTDSSKHRRFRYKQVCFEHSLIKKLNLFQFFTKQEQDEIFAVIDYIKNASKYSDKEIVALEETDKYSEKELERFKSTKKYSKKQISRLSWQAGFNFTEQQRKELAIQKINELLYYCINRSNNIYDTLCKNKHDNGLYDQRPELKRPDAIRHAQVSVSIAHAIIDYRDELANIDSITVSQKHNLLNSHIKKQLIQLYLHNCLEEEQFALLREMNIFDSNNNLVKAELQSHNMHVKQQYVDSIQAILNSALGYEFIEDFLRFLANKKEDSCVFIYKVLYDGDYRPLYCGYDENDNFCLGIKGYAISQIEAKKIFLESMNDANMLGSVYGFWMFFMQALGSITQVGSERGKREDVLNFLRQHPKLQKYKNSIDQLVRINKGVSCDTYDPDAYPIFDPKVVDPNFPIATCSITPFEEFGLQLMLGSEISKYQFQENLKYPNRETSIVNLPFSEKCCMLFGEKFENVREMIEYIIDNNY